MNVDWLTLSEVSNQTQIPVSTVRRYLSQHGMVIRSKKKASKGYVVHPDDVKVIQQIRRGYEEGRTSEEINDILKQLGAPIEVSVTTTEESKMLLPAEAFMQLQESMISMSDEIRSLRAQLYSAHEEIHALKVQHEHSNQQTQEKLESLHNESQGMLTALTSVSEGISRLEREKEARKKESFWSRLFGK